MQASGQLSAAQVFVPNRGAGALHFRDVASVLMMTYPAHMMCIKPLGHSLALVLAHVATRQPECTYGKQDRQPR
ncbi:protein of unknown function [Burkholderia multivorans]